MSISSQPISEREQLSGTHVDMELLKTSTESPLLGSARMPTPKGNGHLYTTLANVLAVRLVRSANTAANRDESGDHLASSLSEKISIQANGVDQGMFIKSNNTDNPVLLFLHGGPGMPESWLAERYPTGLEKHFTVVWWEQRGAGLSFHSDIPPETMAADQFVADTLEVTRYVIERFGRKKIYLMGHSWGSYIGIQAAAAAPEFYHAYIGVGQVTNQLRSERLAFEYAIRYFERVGDNRMLARMQAAQPTATVPLPAPYLALRDRYMHRAGIGTTRAMRSVVTGIFLPSFRSGEYSLMEKINLWRAKMYSRKSAFGMWDTMLATDLTQKITELAIPTYFLHGQYDYTCAYPLARHYLETIDAPVKGFYTFSASAHSPMFEEPNRTVTILLEDVLNGTTGLADDDSKVIAT